MLGFTPLAALPMGEGTPPIDAWMFSTMTVSGTIAPQAIYVVVFTSTLNMASTTDENMLYVADFTSTLNLSSTSIVLGIYVEDWVDYMNLSSRGIQNLIDLDGIVNVELDDDNVVWVVNTETGASGQYEKYGFNSFFNRDGYSYGVTNEGIFKLTGDDDAGADIDALIEIGKQNFGVSFKKKIPYIYIGVGSDGKMYLKLDADGSSYIYEMRSSSTAIKNHRVDPGKGLEGNYWNFTLSNKEGADFAMDTVQFKPLISSRRI